MISFRIIRNIPSECLVRKFEDVLLCEGEATAFCKNKIARNNKSIAKRSPIIPFLVNIPSQRIYNHEDQPFKRGFRRVAIFDGFILGKPGKHGLIWKETSRKYEDGNRYQQICHGKYHTEKLWRAILGDHDSHNSAKRASRRVERVEIREKAAMNDWRIGNIVVFSAQLAHQDQGLGSSQLSSR